MKKADKDGFHYTGDFYVEMHRLIRDKGMTYAGAYESLGFDTGELGYRRAAQAGYRSAKYALERFCYGDDDTVIDLENEAGLKLSDFGISRKAKSEFDIEMQEREKFLEAVLNDVPRLLGDDFVIENG